MILDSANKRVDSVLAELHELKLSLNYSQKDIDEVMLMTSGMQRAG